ncbi:multi-sensor signal transduction histidine kinase [Halovivax asiaticus JCM 14624]|uniref:histidine kinase n=1 Tax=Halovivax asiaticus JCM 14624 TaxID=1227490 RepID=M0BPM4_9EURY|nr:histidine kinase N-terminal 7TM domain-containing protein [Halovivax asiaticus]ELZ11534.1 multi-sensor signal transduction histidine kinase [Halovivax asiaticus JCM 14624]
MAVGDLPFWAILYVLANIAGVVLSLGLGYYAWRHRDEPGATSLVTVVAGATTWSAMVLLRIATGPYVFDGPFWLTTFWNRVMYLGIGLTVAGWFGFALEFTGRERFATRKTVGLLAIHPVAISLVAWFAPDLLWAVFEPSSTDMTGVTSEWGPAFTVHILYAYGLSVVGLFFLLEYIFRNRSLYRKQGLAVLLGSLSPFVGNLVYQGGLVPVDLAPTAYVVTSLAFGWAIFSYQLMDVTPIARDHVVDAIDDAVFVLDRDDRLVDLNPAAAVLFGVDRDAVLGEHVRTVVPTHAELLDRYEDAERVEDEIDVQADDERRSFEIRIYPLFDDHDRLVGRQFLLHDNTHQRRRQRQLEHQNEQLERVVSVVSHDLRNPINVARGYVDMTTETGDLDNLEPAERSFDRMETIIEDVLTMARDGGGVDDTEPVTLDAIAEDGWQQVDTGEATLEVVDSMTFAADRRKLQRLLENLFRNAIDHADGTPTVTVGTIDTDDESILIEGESFGFYVADDGPGIPAGERADVLDAGYTTAETGTGLGLSIVQSIAEAHGWTVEITESRTGGARIELTGIVPVGRAAAV